MEPEGSLPRLQQPFTCPYPKPDQCSPCPPNPNSYRRILILIFPYRLGSSKWSLSHKFPTKTLYAPLLHTCYILRPYPSVQFITRIIFREEYRSLNSSQNYLHSLSWCRLLFPIVSMKIFSHPNFALKSPNRSFMLYFRKMIQNLLSFIIKTVFWK